MTIHPTAIVDDGARLARNVTIGPYCTVGPNVILGEDVELIGHVVLAGTTIIGAGTRIWPFASIGHQPQDTKYQGEESWLEIGAGCTIREHVTMNPGTAGGGLHTRVGARCLFMVGSHVGHDCQIGDDVILANNATLAGHVEIGDFAILGGLSAVHQYVRIGAHAIVGGMTGVDRDVIPYGSVVGNRAEMAGLNLIGLKRRGFERETIAALREAYGMIFLGEPAGKLAGTLASRAAHAAAEFPHIAAVQRLADFIRADTSRSFCTPRDG